VFFYESQIIIIGVIGATRREFISAPIGIALRS